ncbi:MAG TPA: penicillin-binding transpeptidase domain-containing protein, partial [Bacteroidales bacterium]|nr:penicillin-binding transpeptidase domain-containing protein [Bacteroidales bacterium]
GIKSPLDTVPSVCLGSSDVTLLELTTSYCPFLNGGYRVTPMFVTRVEDREGNVLVEFKPEKEKILGEETVFLMQQMFLASLSEPYGTTQNLFSYDLFKYKTDFGGKTGTSSNYSDGWFVGVSPKLVAGTWVGAEERCVHFRSSHLGEGGKTALPTFGLFMEKVMRDTAYTYLRAQFPRYLKGLKDRPYSCYTKYVPRDTVDSVEVDEMGMDSIKVVVPQPVINTSKAEVKQPETQSVEAVENKRPRLFQRREKE